jgi:hypothetical protein
MLMPLSMLMLVKAAGDLLFVSCVAGQFMIEVVSVPYTLNLFQFP